MLVPFHDILTSAHGRTRTHLFSQSCQVFDVSVALLLRAASQLRNSIDGIAIYVPLREVGVVDLLAVPCTFSVPSRLLLIGAAYVNSFRARVAVTAYVTDAATAGANVHVHSAVAKQRGTGMSAQLWRRETEGEASLPPPSHLKKGDSGGPLQCPRADGRYVLAGLTSWGIKCAAPRMPGVFARVATRLDWIRSVVGETP
ncbi:hypothetical protein HPB51_015291 [Rhipicephalus microplus]|uniref:Peptidase S1 domain-containing protein n=1 Tax=Rhipicephalus microplus TaxID=6941 RepID=A0A9J6DVU0_RHIMP|nr:hypothetical protein HPB51_015291 [Rhipicephalus microplus]